MAVATATAVRVGDEGARRPRPVLVHHPDRLVGEAIAAVLARAGVSRVPVAVDRVEALLRSPEVPALVVLTPAGGSADAGGTGVGDIAEALAHRGPATPVLACRDRLTSRTVLADLLDGACGVAALTWEPRRFAAVARAVVAGGLVVPGDVRPALLRALAAWAEERAEARSRLAAMTPRQREVLGLMAAGNRQREIAARLGIAPCTARTHVDQVRAKLAASSQLEGAVLARRTLRLATAPAPPVAALCAPRALLPVG